MVVMVMVVVEMMIVFAVVTRIVGVEGRSGRFDLGE